MSAYARYRIQGQRPNPASFARSIPYPHDMFVLSSIAGGLLFTAFFIGSLGFSSER